jgi:hypothetical protein
LVKSSVKVFFTVFGGSSLFFWGDSKIYDRFPEKFAMNCLLCFVLVLLRAKKAIFSGEGEQVSLIPQELLK